MRLREILRQVREGRTVFISHRGEPVAEVRPVNKRCGTLEERLEQLATRGALVRASAKADRPARGPKPRGALERFLEERHG